MTRPSDSVRMTSMTRTTGDHKMMPISYQIMPDGDQNMPDGDQNMPDGDQNMPSLTSLESLLTWSWRNDPTIRLSPNDINDADDRRSQNDADQLPDYAGRHHFVI